jgi:hypothetical protein
MLFLSSIGGGKLYDLMEPEVNAFLGILQKSLNLKCKTCALESIICCANKVGPYLTLLLSKGVKTTLLVSTSDIASGVIFIVFLVLLLCIQKYLLNTCFEPGTLLVLLI